MGRVQTREDLESVRICTSTYNNELNGCQQVGMEEKISMALKMVLKCPRGRAARARHAAHNFYTLSHSLLTGLTVMDCYSCLPHHHHLIQQFSELPSSFPSIFYIYARARSLLLHTFSLACALRS